MLKEFLLKIQSEGNLKPFFYGGELLLGLIFLITLWFFRPKSPESHFKVREADLKRSPSQTPSGTPTLAEARIRRHHPLQLEGIRLDGQPHEILGVAPRASLTEIQQAYRNLMKRYHPDRVGRPGSREWSDAQKIAEAINQAKENLVREKRWEKK